MNILKCVIFAITSIVLSYYWDADNEHCHSRSLTINPIWLLSPFEHSSDDNLSPEVLSFGVYAYIIWWIRDLRVASICIKLNRERFKIVGAFEYFITDMGTNFPQHFHHHEYLSEFRILILSQRLSSWCNGIHLVCVSAIINFVKISTIFLDVVQWKNFDFFDFF